MLNPFCLYSGATACLKKGNRKTLISFQAFQTSKIPNQLGLAVAPCMSKSLTSYPNGLIQAKRMEIISPWCGPYFGFEIQIDRVNISMFARRHRFGYMRLPEFMWFYRRFEFWRLLGHQDSDCGALSFYWPKNIIRFPFCLFWPCAHAGGEHGSYRTPN